MLIRHKRKAVLGLFLGISFFFVLALIFAPILKGGSGVELSDQLFNRLAKGSSNFIPSLASRLKGFENQEVSVSVEMANAEQAARASVILSKAAPDTTAQGAVVKVHGNLAVLLGAALQDCNAMYLNNADELRDRYGMDGKEVMVVWHNTLNRTAKELQKGNSRDIAQSKMILAVITEGIEPAYNFYGIQPESINHRAGITTFLLVFYLVYTIWWGFGIFFLFEGCGFAMTKARVKREV
jgi:hypothetical protein